MGQFSAAGLEAWVIKRILAFFNRAITAKDITEGVLKDDPGTGTGKYVIGEVVAQRILDQRNLLTGRQFTDIEQLMDIQGMGVDKFHDLVYTFSVPAAEAFKEGMYTNVIGENWILEAHTTRFEDSTEFMNLVNDPEAYQKWLAKEIGEIAEEKYGIKNAGKIARKMLNHSCPVDYESGHLASYAFALWFYRFDQDNWFGFEDVREQAELYLDFMPNPEERIALSMYVGFENRNFLAHSVTVTDLPVVVNYAEQAITIWTAQLND